MITNHKINFKMKKTTLLLTSILLSGLMYAQTGINTLSPKASLDVVAKNTDGSTVEGIIAPRLTGDQIIAADTKYGMDQIGVIVYATAAITGNSVKAASITSPGYYYFNGSVWQNISNRPATFTTVTTAYTASATDEIIFANFSSPNTVTLPASPLVGKKYTIKRIGSQTVFVSGGGNNIDGAATYGGMIRRYQFVNVIFNGSTWSIIGLGR